LHQGVIPSDSRKTELQVGLALWWRNLKQTNNDCFLPLFFDEHRFLVLKGGGGSGKSIFAGRKILERATSEPGHRVLVVRKVARTIAKIPAPCPTIPTASIWLAPANTRMDIPQVCGILSPACRAMMAYAIPTGIKPSTTGIPVRAPARYCALLLPIFLSSPSLHTAFARYALSYPPFPLLSTHGPAAEKGALCLSVRHCPTDRPFRTICRQKTLFTKKNMVNLQKARIHLLPLRSGKE